MHYKMHLNWHVIVSPFNLSMYCRAMCRYYTVIFFKIFRRHTPTCSCHGAVWSVFCKVKVSALSWIFHFQIICHFCYTGRCHNEIRLQLWYVHCRGCVDYWSADGIVTSVRPLQGSGYASIRMLYCRTACSRLMITVVIQLIILVGFSNA